MTDKVKMRPLWSKEACLACGEEGFATRTQPRPVTEEYYCEACEIHRQYEEEIRVLNKELEEYRNPNIQEDVFRGGRKKTMSSVTVRMPLLKEGISRTTVSEIVSAEGYECVDCNENMVSSCSGIDCECCALHSLENYQRWDQGGDVGRLDIKELEEYRNPNTQEDLSGFQVAAIKAIAEEGRKRGMLMAKFEALQAEFRQLKDLYSTLQLECEK